MRVTSEMEAGGVRPGGTTLRGAAANTPLLSPPLPACHAARAPASGRPSVCRASPSRYDFVHHNFLGRECSSAKIVLAMDVLQGYVREKRSLRPQRGSCRKWSICDGRQKKIFQTSRILAKDCRSSAARLNLLQGLIMGLKNFSGHRTAECRQMPLWGRLTCRKNF